MTEDDKEALKEFCTEFFNLDARPPVTPEPMAEDDKEALKEFLTGFFNVVSMTAFFFLIVVLISLL